MTSKKRKKKLAEEKKKKELEDLKNDEIEKLAKYELEKIERELLEIERIETLIKASRILEMLNLQMQKKDIYLLLRQRLKITGLFHMIQDMIKYALL